MKVTRLWDFCGVLKGVFFAFLVSLFNCFNHFIAVFDYSVGRSMLSCYHGVHFMDSDEELLLAQNCFSQEVLEPWFRMGNTDRPTENFGRRYNDCYRWRWRTWQKEGISNTRINTSWAVRDNRVWSEWAEEGNDSIQIIGDSETILQVNPEILTNSDKDELNCWLGKFVVEVWIGPETPISIAIVRFETDQMVCTFLP